MEAGRAALAASIGSMSERAAKIDPAGFYFAPSPAYREGSGMYFAHPLPADRPCQMQYELAWQVAWIEGGPAVMFAADRSR
jgi:hypothetical protein